MKAMRLHGRAASHLLSESGDDEYDVDAALDGWATLDDDAGWSERGGSPFVGIEMSAELFGGLFRYILAQ